GLSGISEKVEDRARDQIEYTDEDPMIREKFESELSRKGLQSVMPDEAYRNPDYEWSYTQKKAS
ncbi:MAG TPA: cupin domain-containing protein, partial [Verrucomicrobiae bacterium]|nr:cupin domain-containing protein [Verrucomicrobiae bacterium]